MPVYSKKDNHGKIISYYTSFYYVDWRGTRKRKKKEGFSLRRDAIAYERNFLEKQAGSPDMSFASLVELYQQDSAVRLKPNSIRTKTLIIERHILPFFADFPINTITAAMVRNWQTSIISNNNYSPCHLKQIHAQLSSIFNFSIKFYHLPINPAKNAGSMGQATHHVNFWTLEEFELFISELKQPRTILGFNILYWTGCRVGEMLALTPIDFSNNEMSISKTLLRLDDGQQIIHTPKTVASKRNVSLPDFLVKMIKDYINRLKLESTDLLFLAPGQKHIDKGFLRWSMESYSKKIGIKRLRIHDLRHSHASLLIKMGFSPVDIAARLGHDKVETTLNTYSHLWPNAAKKLADDLENVHSTKKAVRF